MLKPQQEARHPYEVKPPAGIEGLLLECKVSTKSK